MLVGAKYACQNRQNLGRQGVVAVVAVLAQPLPGPAASPSGCTVAAGRWPWASTGSVCQNCQNCQNLGGQGVVAVVAVLAQPSRGPADVAERVHGGGRLVDVGVHEVAG
ncbi:hypothetical protein KRM28CT15_60980 [Krasilnikovia sp. M28-CT-15]